MAGVNPSNQLPPSANAPLPGQSSPLSTWRQPSSIPTGSSSSSSASSSGGSSGGSPSGGPSGGGSLADGMWVYPSEQMFYNAMRRKGWAPSEGDMTAVVAIHNAVNERAWREIMQWEAAQGGAAGCGGPRLLKLRGRPKDFSPKARLLNLMGYKLPFDRHDWVVDRCGQHVRCAAAGGACVRQRHAYALGVLDQLTALCQAKLVQPPVVILATARHGAAAEVLPSC